MKRLLEGQEVAADFRSKAGKTFHARVRLNEEGDYGFDFQSENGRAEATETKALHEKRITADKTTETEKEPMNNTEEAFS